MGDLQKEVFNANDIVIPFPIRTLEFYSKRCDEDLRKTENIHPEKTLFKFAWIRRHPIDTISYHSKKVASFYSEATFTFHDKRTYGSKTVSITCITPLD